MTAATPDRRIVAPDAPKTNHRRVAAEFAVFFGVLLLADAHWFGGTRFAGLAVHPFWAPVLLAAAVYGSGTGFVVAATASLLWLTGVHAPFHADEDYFRYVLGRTLLPLLWLSVALMLGELVSARQRRLANVIERARELSRQSDALAGRYATLTGLNRELQIAITTCDRTAAHVLDLAAQLAAPEPAAFGDTLATIIAAASGNDSFYLYLNDRGELLPVLAGAGSHGDAPDLRGSALYPAVVREGNLIHAGSSRGRQLLGDAGMLALQIRHGRDGSGIGLLLFRALPLDMFTDIRLGEIAAMSGWLSEIVGHRHALLAADTGLAPYRTAPLLAAL